jgi:UDP-glucuronate 4-epimerase
LKILVTGTAGFIGSTLTKKLLDQGHEVFGIDNLNDYYDVNLKLARLEGLSSHKNFKNFKISLEDTTAMQKAFSEIKPDMVVNLAAQAGVRYSLTNPHAYIDSNITGFLNVLEGCRHNKVKHLVFASTSSVYGINTNMPFSEHSTADHPVSLYAATKRSNELMAHSYSALFDLPCTGLRFFTVYGPWGRPDMALFLFTKNILENKPIDVFNNGKHMRDFTYVDDIVEGVARVLQKPPKQNPDWNSNQPDPANSKAAFRIYNIGNNRSEQLMRYIEVLEDCLGKKAEKNFLPLQAGDIYATSADVTDLGRDFDYKPKTSIDVGVKNFVAWYRNYYKV